MENALLNGKCSFEWKMLFRMENALSSGKCTTKGHFRSFTGKGRGLDAEDPPLVARLIT